MDNHNFKTEYPGSAAKADTWISENWTHYKADPKFEGLVPLAQFQAVEDARTEILRELLPKAFIIEPDPQDYEATEADKLTARTMTPALDEYLVFLIDEIEDQVPDEILSEAPEKLPGIPLLKPRKKK